MSYTRQWRSRKAEKRKHGSFISFMITSSSRPSSCKLQVERETSEMTTRLFPTRMQPTLLLPHRVQSWIKPWISIADEFHRQTHWHRISLATSRSRPTERPEPRLPLDLEREIFELTAHLYPETRPRLLLVARRVRCWLEPLLYKTLVVDGLHEAHRIVSLATTKPPGFFAGITRRLVLSADSHTPTQILALCKGVTHLAIEDDILREQWQCIHPFFFSLEHVQRLAFAARELRTFDPTAPVFSHLTHLTLLDCSYDKLPPFVSALPSLTHLALFHPPTCSIVQDLLADCPHLRLMVLIAPSRHWAVVAAGSTPRPRTLTDERLVICVSKDWKEGVGEGYTYWDVAEIFLRDKQRGAVDASSYLALKD